MRKEKEFFILTIDGGRKNFVGDKRESSFWYTQQPEKDISIEPYVDAISELPELGVWVDGEFACSFEVKNLNEFFERFFDRYIAKHEHVEIESGLSQAVTDKELKAAIKRDKVLQKLNKAFYERLKKISESYGYIVGESEGESA